MASEEKSGKEDSGGDAASQSSGSDGNDHSVGGFGQYEDIPHFGTADKDQQQLEETAGNNNNNISQQCPTSMSWTSSNSTAVIEGVSIVQFPSPSLRFFRGCSGEDSLLIQPLTQYLCWQKSTTSSVGTISKCQ